MRRRLQLLNTNLNIYNSALFFSAITKEIRGSIGFVKTEIKEDNKISILDGY